MEERQRYEEQQKTTSKKGKKILARQHNRCGFLDMLEQRYRHQQFQDMMKKVQDQTELADVAAQDDGQAPTNAAGKKGETLLAKAARENKLHLEALASELEKNGGELNQEEEAALNSARSGD